MKTWKNKSSDELFNAVLELASLDEARRFFRDLLTEGEILEFANRFKVAKMLYTNKPYSKIEKNTGMSSTTIARISKWLHRGKNGYRLIFDRTVGESRHHMHSKSRNVL